MAPPHHFNCGICAKSFSTQKALEQHNQLFHNQHQPQSTSPSSSTSKWRTTAARQSPLPFSCTDCRSMSFTFATQKELDKHQRFSTVHRQEVSKKELSKLTFRASQLPIAGRVYLDKSGRWSVISEDKYQEVLELLSRHCHSEKQLLNSNYVLAPYSDSDIANLRKCSRCSRLEHGSKWAMDCTFHPGKRIKVKGTQTYRCCGKEGKGCVSQPSHDYQDSPHTEKLLAMAMSPAAESSNPKHPAVILDCEMASVKHGNGTQQELIVVCLVDYLTGEVLLDKLVRPAEKVVDWTTWCHGITHDTMEAAILQGQALDGWEEARQEVWKFVDENTIVVGHAVHHDLDILRIIHTRIVDSPLLVQAAVSIPSRQWGLETLCEQLLHIKIRENSSKVHSCLEDVLATREVVLWCTQNEDELGIWARFQKAEEDRRLEERRVVQERKQQGKNERELKGAGKFQVVQ